MKKKSSVEQYRQAVDRVVREFLMKQDFQEDGEPYSYEFVGSGYDIIEVCDYYLNLSDIIYDTKNNISKGKFFEWYDYTLEWSMNGYGNVNYRSYIMGYRHKERDKWQEFVYQVKNKLKWWWFILKNRTIHRNYSKNIKDKIDEFNKQIIKENVGNKR